MQTDEFVRNVERYCAFKGVKPTVACAESGAGKNLMSQLRHQGTVPSVERIQLLAQYLGCTVSDLLGERANGNSSPPSEEDELLEKIRTLNRQERKDVEDFLAFLASRREKT